MRNITFVVTTSGQQPKRCRYIWADFCSNNNLRFIPSCQKAINDITGDEYRFYNILSLEDGHKLMGLVVHSYIHLDPLPILGGLNDDKDKELQHYLLSRLRRPPLQAPKRECITEKDIDKMREEAFPAAPRPPVRKYGGIFDRFLGFFKSFS